MAERKIAGKKATSEGVAARDEKSGEVPPLRPAQCRAYMRRELAREFRGIVEGFVDEAKKGSCQHVKLATELVGAPERPRRRGKSTAQELIEVLEARPNQGWD